MFIWNYFTGNTNTDSEVDHEENENADNLDDNSEFSDEEQTQKKDVTENLDDHLKTAVDKFEVEKESELVKACDPYRKLYSDKNSFFLEVPPIKSFSACVGFASLVPTKFLGEFHLMLFEDTLVLSLGSKASNPALMDKLEPSKTSFGIRLESNDFFVGAFSFLKHIRYAGTLPPLVSKDDKNREAYRSTSVSYSAIRIMDGSKNTKLDLTDNDKLGLRITLLTNAFLTFKWNEKSLAWVANDESSCDVSHLNIQFFKEFTFDKADSHIWDWVGSTVVSSIKEEAKKFLCTLLHKVPTYMPSLFERLAELKPKNTVVALTGKFSSATNGKVKTNDFPLDLSIAFRMPVSSFAGYLTLMLKKAQQELQKPSTLSKLSDKDLHELAVEKLMTQFNLKKEDDVREDLLKKTMLQLREAVDKSEQAKINQAKVLVAMEEGSAHFEELLRDMAGDAVGRLPQYAGLLMMISEALQGSENSNFKLAVSGDVAVTKEHVAATLDNLQLTGMAPSLSLPLELFFPDSPIVKTLLNQAMSDEALSKTGKEVVQLVQTSRTQSTQYSFSGLADIKLSDIRVSGPFLKLLQQFKHEHKETAEYPLMMELLLFIQKYSNQIRLHIGSPVEDILFSGREGIDPIREFSINKEHIEFGFRIAADIPLDVGDFVKAALRAGKAVLHEVVSRGRSLSCEKAALNVLYQDLEKLSTLNSVLMKHCENSEIDTARTTICLKSDALILNLKTQLYPKPLPSSVKSITKKPILKEKEKEKELLSSEEDESLVLNKGEKEKEKEKEVVEPSGGTSRPWIGHPSCGLHTAFKYAENECTRSRDKQWTMMAGCAPYNFKAKPLLDLDLDL